MAARSPRLTNDRNIDWLGSTPSRWGIIPSKRLFSNRKQQALAADEQLTASQDFGVIPQKDFMRKAGRQVVQVVLNPEILKHVERDDFVISMRSFQGGLERAWATGCISSAYVVLEPTGLVDVAYFAYLFKSTAYIKALQTTSNLVRDGQALRFDNFCLVDLPLVPVDEQRAIADLLDCKTAVIDGLIEKKRSLVATLDDQRGRYLHYYVTQNFADVSGKAGGQLWADSIRHFPSSFGNTVDEKVISSWLRDSRPRLDQLKATLGEQLQRLHEYREALINRAVLGQIDLTTEVAK